MSTDSSQRTASLGRPVRVLVALPQPGARSGVRAALAGCPDLTVVGEAADPTAAAALAVATTPDVAAADPALLGPGWPSGVRVVGYAWADAPAVVAAALAAGAAGCVLMRSAGAELARAIRAVAVGGHHLDPAVAEMVVTGELPGGRPEGPSDREGEVVRLIAHGYSNAEVAARLGLSVTTVESYETRSLEKLGLRSRADLVRYAGRRSG